MCPMDTMSPWFFEKLHKAVSDHAENNFGYELKGLWQQPMPCSLEERNDPVLPQALANFLPFPAARKEPLLQLQQQPSRLAQFSHVPQQQPQQPTSKPKLGSFDLNEGASTQSSSLLRTLDARRLLGELASSKGTLATGDAQGAVAMQRAAASMSKLQRPHSLPVKPEQVSQRHDPSNVPAQLPAKSGKPPAGRQDSCDWNAFTNAFDKRKHGTSEVRTMLKQASMTLKETGMNPKESSMNPVQHKDSCGWSAFTNAYDQRMHSTSELRALLKESSMNGKKDYRSDSRASTRASSAVAGSLSRKSTGDLSGFS